MYELSWSHKDCCVAFLQIGAIIDYPRYRMCFSFWMSRNKEVTTFITAFPPNLKGTRVVLRDRSIFLASTDKRNIFHRFTVVIAGLTTLARGQRGHRFPRSLLKLIVSWRCRCRRVHLSTIRDLAFCPFRHSDSCDIHCLWWSLNWVPTVKPASNCIVCLIWSHCSPTVLFIGVLSWSNSFFW